MAADVQYSGFLRCGGGAGVNLSGGESGPPSPPSGFLGGFGGGFGVPTGRGFMERSGGSAVSGGNGFAPKQAPKKDKPGFDDIYDSMLGF